MFTNDEKRNVEDFIPTIKPILVDERKENKPKTYHDVKESSKRMTIVLNEYKRMMDDAKAKPNNVGMIELRMWQGELDLFKWYMKMRSKKSKNLCEVKKIEEKINATILCATACEIHRDNDPQNTLLTLDQIDKAVKLFRLDRAFESPNFDLAFHLGRLLASRWILGLEEKSIAPDLSIINSL